MSEFRIPSDRQPFLHPGTDVISRPWFLFLSALFTRVGGATGTGNVALDALVAEIQTQAALAEASGPALGVLGDLAMDMQTESVFAQVPNHELARRLADIEILGVFAK